MNNSYPSFIWVTELYEAVAAIGKRPTDFNAENLEMLYQALLKARVPPENKHRRLKLAVLAKGEKPQKDAWE